MGLSERRVSELLSRAMRAYPMPADPEPVEVLYEDEDLIGVNKPPGEWQESDGGRGPGVMSIACSRADDWASSDALSHLLSLLILPEDEWASN